MKKFSVGQKLTARSVCNHDCIYSGVVIKRTPKFVTIEIKGYGERRVKVHVYDDYEMVFPLGRYSMAPIFKAGKQQ